MAVAIFVSIASVVAGTALALTPRSSALLGVIRTFALTAALAVVALHLLPEAFVRLGAWCLVALAGGLAAPWILERLGRVAWRLGRAPDGPRRDSVALEAGYYGLLVHSVGDGLGLGAYTGELSAGHVHEDVVIALSAHTVPVVAMVVLVFDSIHGRRSAIIRAGALALATVAGVLSTSYLPARDAAESTAWISAAVAGLLVHVVTHGLSENPPEGTAMRLADVTAAGLGIAVSLIGGHAHDHAAPSPLRAAFVQALTELSVEAAPLLLVGLGVSALVQAFATRTTPALVASSAPMSALRGALEAARRPQSAKEPVVTSEALRLRGTAPAFVTSFLLSAPALGVETFVLTVHFLSWPLASARLVGSLLVAIASAIAVGSIAPPTPPAHQAEQGHRPTLSSEWLRGFDGLTREIAPWMVVGVLIAAFADSFIKTASLDGGASRWLEVGIATLVTVPSYVCAPAMVPLAAVLLTKGLSPAAVLVGLLFGPALSILTFSYVRGTFGLRAVVSFGVTALATTWALAFGVGSAMSIGPEPTIAVRPHAHPTLWWIGTLIFGALLLRSLWLSGTRGWLAPIFPGHSHEHDHGANDEGSLDHVHAHR